MLPSEFVNNLKDELGEEKALKVLQGLDNEPLVSVRANPFKISLKELEIHFGELSGDGVEWASDEAFYLKDRPSFTLDPLFHAGAYYVQEASSMYIGNMFDRAVAELGRKSINVLDLCAAPGGKTTQLLSHLPSEGYLVANEVISSRVAILAENTAKWGCPNVIVTNSDASAFGRAAGRKGGNLFDVIVADVPCSGEGMFRKRSQATENWSSANVNLCASRQRRIVSDVWEALQHGGFMIYSTCTFNRHENEDNVRWICEELGAETVEMRHFYPGIDRGEGFFASLIRKTSGRINQSSGFSTHDMREIKVFKSLFPEADMALSTNLDRSKYEVVELNRENALKFLSKAPLVFPDKPLGLLLLTYEDQAIGFVKNLGRRSNNLHPMPRRIRNLNADR